jgi:hypothetical protein
MNPFHEMLRKVTSSPYHDKLARLGEPLQAYLGINHFWYYQITTEGNYAFLGSHTAWTEYCFDSPSLESFPCLRHPNALSSGISLMKAAIDTSY